MPPDLGGTGRAQGEEGPETSVDPNTLIELAKEFGGGFVAYWTHNVFHRVWHASGRVRKRKGVSK